MDSDVEDVGHPIPNAIFRPSYMDLGVPGSPTRFDFDDRVMKKLSNEFADCGDQDRVRTYLRIRPPTFRTAKATTSEQEVFRVQDDYTLVIRQPPKKHATADTNESTYTYSRVFGEETQQTVLFEHCVHPLLNGFLDGKNALIFSYGASNSGKTYTMQGYGKDYGILPRTLQYLFNRLGDALYKEGDIKPHQFDSYVILDEQAQKDSAETKARVLREAKIKPSEMKSFAESMIRLNTSAVTVSSTINLAPGDAAFPSMCSSRDVSYASLPEKSAVYSVWVSFAEIYNDGVYDLFDGVTKGKERRRQLKVVQDKRKCIYIKDLTECNVNTPLEAYQFFLAGKQNLQFAATNMNTNSSRSHSFFNIRIVVIGKAGATVYPKEVRRFSFCDLAGLERVSQTGNYGLRLKESGNINKSLLGLLRCIRGLREQQLKKSKAGVIPYRENQLTRLFQSYVTTATQVSMIVNVNPDEDMLDASIQVIQNSAVASMIRTFKKVPAPRDNTSFSHKLRQSIRIAHGEEDSEDEDESDEPTPIVSTVKQRRPIAKTVTIQAENQAFENQLRDAEQVQREQIKQEFDQLIEKQKQYYEGLLKTEREYGRTETKMMVDKNLGVVNELVKKCIIEETEMDESPSPPPRRYTIGTPSARPLVARMPDFQLQEEYSRALKKIEDLEDVKRERVETGQNLMKPREDESSESLGLVSVNGSPHDRITQLEQAISDGRALLKLKDEQIKHLQDGHPELERVALTNQVKLLVTQSEIHKESIAVIKKELAEAEEHCLKYEERLRVANAKLQKVTQDFNELFRENCQLKRDFEEFQLDRNDAEAEIDKLRAELGTMKKKSLVKPPVLASKFHVPGRSPSSPQPSEVPRRVYGMHAMNGSPFMPRKKSGPFQHTLSSPFATPKSK